MGGLEKWMNDCAFSFDLCYCFPIISLLIIILLSKTNKNLAIGKHNNITLVALTLIIYIF